MPLHSKSSKAFGSTNPLLSCQRYDLPTLLHDFIECLTIHEEVNSFPPTPTLILFLTDISSSFKGRFGSCKLGTFRRVSTKILVRLVAFFRTGSPNLPLIELGFRLTPKSWRLRTGGEGKGASSLSLSRASFQTGVTSIPSGIRCAAHDCPALSFFMSPF